MNEIEINSFLTFLLDGETFAISVKKVLEVIETGEEHTITHLPKAPPAICGVVNFRGNVIPVVDTRIKFDLDPHKEGDRFVIIVLQLNINGNEHFVGAMADKVVDVIEIDQSMIKPIPEVGKGYNSDYIKGVVHRNNSFVMLLNLEAALGTTDIINLNSDSPEDGKEPIEEFTTDIETN